MYMTYQELLERLLIASKEELSQNVTVVVDGEFYPVDDYDLTDPDDDDVLDSDHLILKVEG